MIYLTGDTHGDLKRLSHKNWPEGKLLTKDDYVIILGDFGVVWNHIQSNRNEIFWLEWLDEKPWTTLFIDGNHECHPRLQSDFPIIDKFNGKVGHISDTVYHLRRGETYIIDDKSFFTMGGAYSIDRTSRMLHVSWWNEEIPTREEFDYGLTNLELIGNKVDYILGHTTSVKAIIRMLKPTWLVDDEVANYFDHIEDIVEFKRFYFGHWHKDKEDKTHRVLYKDIILLGE